MYKIFTTFLILTLSFTAIADDPNVITDDHTLNSDVLNNSAQHGYVNQNSTMIQTGSRIPYDSAGTISCAKSSLNFGVAGGGNKVYDSKSIYAGISIPFGSGDTCEKLMAEELLQKENNTRIGLTNHCKDMLSSGLQYKEGIGNPIQAKCSGFELTGMGKEVLAVKKEELKVRALKAKTDSMGQQSSYIRNLVALHDACAVARQKGIADRFDECLVHKPSQHQHN